MASLEALWGFISYVGNLLSAASEVSLESELYKVAHE